MAIEETNHQRAEEKPSSEGSGAAGGNARKIILFVLVLAAVVIVAWGILKRRHSASELESYTDANAAPTVSMATPALEKSSDEIVLPGNMQAFSMAPIYARTTGYVKSWSRDIGARVRQGEVLAIIETPELDKQLAQARAELEAAKTNAGLARTTATRYQDLVGENAVSQQDTDTAVNQLKASSAQVASAEANVQRLEELQSFEKIIAPFDGVITARNIDIGQLIGANGSTVTTGAGLVAGNRQVFDISKVDRLRVYINIPQQYAPAAKNGSTATLTLPQYPGKTFQGTLVRSSNAVDPVSRTLLAEVDVDNRSGELLPGSYAEVHLHASNPVAIRVVPVSALVLLPQGTRLVTVDANHHARFIPVVVGRDLGATTEIVSGLEDGQQIIANPPDSLTDGEEVRVVSTKGNSLGQAR
ncbi:MAG: efflux RND transporter periplasmic adaptor subunit [Acidobacteriaceae bacterium]|nr:efflux RND transporter periplasmic adaptor subunit [Acidobacteriaceae bacterium]